MPDAKPVVLITEPLSDVPLAWLGERAEVVQTSPGEPGWGGHLARTDGMVVRTYTEIDDALLSAGKNLRVIGRAGVALDNFDLPACEARGVSVVHAPGANSSAVAEYVFAILFDELRPRVLVDHAHSLEEWANIRSMLIAPRQLEQLTLGIYGLGKIGKRVARIAAAFNMRVIYNDLLDMPEDQRWGAEPVGVDELLSTSDVLTIHVDDRQSNRNLINDEALAGCKPDAVIMNCARGLIVDPHALAGFLCRNPDAAALLDVHEPEPFGKDYPLIGLPNAKMRPHIAAATELAKENMSWVVRDVWRVLAGETPEHPAF